MGFFEIYDEADMREEDLPTSKKIMPLKDGALGYHINKLLNPNKVLLIDDPKTMAMLSSLRIVIDALPNGHELKDKNPLNDINELLNQFAVKSGDYDKRGMVGGYQEINGNGKKLNKLEIAKNRFNHREQIINQLSTVEQNLFRVVDGVTEHWDALVAASDKVISSKYLSEEVRSNIEDTFADKEKTIKAITALRRDISSKKENIYAQRLGVEGEISSAMSWR